MSSSAAAGAGAPSASKPTRPVSYPLKDPGRVVPVETFVAESRRLLDLERSAEVEERTACLRDTPDTDLEARGLTLLTLAVLEASSGLFGRSVISLGDPASRLLPSHRFSVGDIVGIRAANSSKASVAHDVTGIVSKVNREQSTCCFLS